MDSNFMERVKEVEKRKRELLGELGFFIDAVYPVEGDGQYYANVRTFGLKENKNHMDLQIVMPIAPRLCMIIINMFVESIDNGCTYADGQIVEQLLDGVKFKLIKKLDEGRDVLRILIADDNGLLPGEAGCEDIFNMQDNVDFE